MNAAAPIVLVRERLPPRLSDLEEPPNALFLRGELPRGPTVAIVGTRSPTPEGVRFARDLARDLTRAGVTVLSGGALGIDSAAHRGALLGGGATVVVAPAGYAVPYPPENAGLFERIVALGGAYVSLVPDDEVATRAAFFARNECLAALSHALVVVQADVRSGARNAAAAARKLGRPLFAVPSAPWIHRGRGCLLELRLGAGLCEGARDVLDVLERSGLSLVAPGPARRRRKRRPPTARQDPMTSVMEGSVSTAARVSGELPPASDEARVFSAVQRGARHIDEVGVELGLPVARIHAALLTLRLQGVLVCRPTGELVIAKSPI